MVQICWLWLFDKEYCLALCMTKDELLLAAQ